MPAAIDYAEHINQNLDGWSRANGLRFVRATADEVCAELEIGPQHRQPMGIVHGGVHCAIVEAVCSVGATLDVLPGGGAAVGLENHTSFLHAVREGTLRGTARPLTKGHRTQVWEATITDAAGHLLATGRVRLLCLEKGSPVAGSQVAPWVRD